MLAQLKKLFTKKPEPEQIFSKIKVKTILPGKIVRLTAEIPSDAEIIERYQAGYKNMAAVTIFYSPETLHYYYYIEEPPVSEIVENLYYQVKEKLYTVEIGEIEEAESKEDLYEKYIGNTLSDLGMGDAYYKYPELRYYLIRDIVGWKVIDVPMRDTRVEEIDYSSLPGSAKVVVSHDKVYSTWVDTNIVLSENELTELVEFIAFKCNKTISVAHPLLEARTPEGYRVAANLKEIGKAPGFTIRKFPSSPRAITKLVANKTLSPLMAAYLWTLVENMKFVMIIGGMASGKTTLLQAVLSAVPMDKKIVTIEDVPELNLSHPHWQPLYTRRSIYGSEQDITLIDLARYSLRTRGQYIVIGEVRDREIQTLVQMAASGHGSLCTFHAEDPKTLFLRMTSPPLSVQASFIVAIAAVVLQAKTWVRKLQRYDRRTLKIWEIVGVKETVREGEIPVKYRKIFEWNPDEDIHMPVDVDEVIRRSKHLKIIAKNQYGDKWYDAIRLELERKTQIIEGLVKNRVFDYKEVTDYIYRASLLIKQEIDKML